MINGKVGRKLSPARKDGVLNSGRGDIKMWIYLE